MTAPLVDVADLTARHVGMLMEVRDADGWLREGTLESVNHSARNTMLGVRNNDKSFWCGHFKHGQLVTFTATEVTP